MTDLGYAHEPQVVWELLDEINGYDPLRSMLILDRNTEYVNSYFQTPVVQIPQPQQANSSTLQSFSQLINGSNPSPSDPDEDFRLALEVSKLEYGAGGPQSTQYQSSPLPPSSPGIIGYARPSSNLSSQTQETYTSPLHNQSNQSHFAPTQTPVGYNSHTADQEEFDRLHALALQEEFRRQAEQIDNEQYLQESGTDANAFSAEMILGKKIHPEELERYKQAERQYLSSLQQQPESKSPPPQQESSKCVIQ